MKAIWAMREACLLMGSPLMQKRSRDWGSDSKNWWEYFVSNHESLKMVYYKSFKVVAFKFQCKLGKNISFRFQSLNDYWYHIPKALKNACFKLSKLEQVVDFKTTYSSISGCPGSSIPTLVVTHLLPATLEFGRKEWLLRIETLQTFDQGDV